MPDRDKVFQGMCGSISQGETATTEPHKPRLGVAIVADTPLMRAVDQVKKDVSMWLGATLDDDVVDKHQHRRRSFG